MWLYDLDKNMEGYVLVNTGHGREEASKLEDKPAMVKNVYDRVNEFM